MDAVLVATGYVIGLGLRLMDQFLGEPWLFYRNLAVALPLIVLVHLSLNGLAGSYWFPSWPAKVSVGTTVLANTVAVMILFAWGVSSSIRPIPLSVFILGGLCAMVLMVMAQFGRSKGRELSERLFPTT